MKPNPICLHVGLAPFIDSGGEKVGSFQALNSDGKAIATVTFSGNRIEQFFCIESISRVDFLKQARALFDETPTTTFDDVLNSETYLNEGPR